MLRHVSQPLSVLEIDWAPIGAEAATQIDNVNNTLASDALRVLSFSFVPLTKEDLLALAGMDEADLRLNYLLDGPVTMLGMIGILDPPRSGVDKAIATCGTAGVKVMMITGDQKTTATAIAREIGIVRG